MRTPPVLDRLSRIDASLLTMEKASTPLHVGGLGVFAPGLGFADVTAALTGRLGGVPLARKRLQAIGFGTGELAWVDDVEFDLTYHLRHAALPPPGDDHQLGEYLSRLIARPLDRGRPLWETYVIEGLAGGRVGLFRKTHLAMAGADNGDPFSVLLDDQPGDADAAGQPLGPWQAAAAPSSGARAAAAVRSRVERAEGIGRTLADAALAPSRAVAGAASTAVSALGVVARLVGSAPASPLNRRLTPHRRFATASLDLDDFRTVRRAFGGSVNDVVVAITAAGVGRLLRARGHDTTDLDLRVMVPVRSGPLDDDVPPAEGIGATRTVGDGVVGVLAPLPVMEMDAVARLYRIMGEMAGLKESRQAVAADRLARLAGYGPANLHARAARLVSAEHRYNVALSNAPGPQAPRYVAGVELERSYPFIPLAGDAALSVAVSSYAGGVYFGLLGDREGLPDLDALGGFIGDSLAELVAAATP